MGLEARDAGLDYESYALAGVLELAALVGFVAWWLLRPVPVMAAMGLAMRLSPDAALECPSFRSPFSFRAWRPCGQSFRRRDHESVYLH
jgi:hypothetical protein